MSAELHDDDLAPIVRAVRAAHPEVSEDEARRWLLGEGPPLPDDERVLYDAQRRRTRLRGAFVKMRRAIWAGVALGVLVAVTGCTWSAPTPEPGPTPTTTQPTVRCLATEGCGTATAP